MEVVGLFAGIGGFELGFHKAGFHTSLLVESDEAAQQVLAKNFRDVRLHDDVTTLQKLPRKAKLVLAGFPCQDLSMVGSRNGLKGSKSSLVDNLFRLVRPDHVETVVIENVYFMLHLDRGAAMDSLVTRFEALGFKWAYRVLDTMGFGLPQRRRRVYLVASRTLDPRMVLFADERVTEDTLKPSIDKPLGFYWTEGRSGVGLTVDGIPPLKVGSAVGIPSTPAVLFPDGEVLTPNPEACARLQGFSSTWIPTRLQLLTRSPVWRLTGNAVSVPVSSWVAHRIAHPGAVRKNLALAEISKDRHWPDAAWNVDGTRVKVQASDKPIRRKLSSIEHFRDDGWRRLSDRALDGFLRRLTEGNLWTPAGFVQALKAAARRPVSTSRARESAELQAR